jgi:hypothetical protein
VKKIKLTAILVALFCLFSCPAWATVTVEGGYGYFTVTLDGSGGFTWATATITSGIGSGETLSLLYPKGIQLTAISVKAGAAGSKTIVRNGTATGELLYPPEWYSVDGGPQHVYFTDGRWYKPCIVHADNTSDSGTKVTFVFNN